MTTQEIVKFLRDKKVFLQEKFSVKEIGLFGSYAKKQETKDSDIDIYVIYKQKNLDNMTGLWLYLEEVFNKKVDLFHYHDRLRKGLKEQIEKEVIYA